MAEWRFTWMGTIESDPDARPIKADEESRLWPLARSGDEAAKLQLLKSQWLLVWNIAKRYEWTGADLDDLIGCGMFALCKAFKAFDYKRGLRFTTYCHTAIRQELARYAQSQTVTCTVPRGFFSPSYRELANITPVVFANTVAAFRRSNNFGVVGLDGSETELSSMASVSSEHDGFDEAENNDLAERVSEGIAATLDERSAFVVRRRMAGETLDEIKVQIGVSRERVRQIESEARGKLKIWLKSHAPQLSASLESAA